MTTFAKWLAGLMTALGMMMLAACGGGGGSAGTSSFGTGSGSGTGTGTGTGTTGSPSLVVSISKTTVTAAAPAVVTATVTNAAGAPLANQVVAFSTASGLGAFNVSTALTDAVGNAVVLLSPATTSANGADLVVAELTTASGTSATPATIGFQVIAASVPPAGTPTVSVTLSSTSVTSISPALLTAVVRNAAGSPVGGLVVKFSTVDSLGTFDAPSALSDANGQVTVKLAPATSSTKGADVAVVQATVDGYLATGTAAFSVTSTNAPVVGVPSMALVLSTTAVTTSAPALVSAVVKDATGAGVAGQVIRFRTIDGLGTFDTTSALTDASGSANVTLSATTAGVSGADQVVASTTVNGTALQVSQGFRLTAPNVAIGSFTSDVASGALSAYGQANLTVVLTGAPAATPVGVSLSSTCVAKGKASLTPSTASTTTGTATFTYRDQGCGATDQTDSLQASVTGTPATGTLSIALTSPAVASINFVSATPTTIYLKGSGYTETSSVNFRVLDTAGNGLPNQNVVLEATTLAGGLTLDSGSEAVTKLSDNLGNVNVTINSGTVPTPVRVKATLSGLGISTVSSNLSIAVGLPSQLNFSLSQTTLNIEGYDIDGTPNVYSIIASDRLANPVPTSTAINFIAESGQIEPSKFIVLASGLARTSANFITSSPRPADGRLTVVAYAIGEESFVDVNGNNVHDVGEYFQDLGNVYLNRLFDGSYDNATDQFIALSLPGVSAASECVLPPPSVPAYSLLALGRDIPSVPKTCDGVWGRAYVRRAAETVLSTSVARPLWFGAPAGLVDSLGDCTATRVSLSAPDFGDSGQLPTFYQLSGRTVAHALPATGTLSFLMADRNPVRLNPMAAGTTLTATATTGLTVSVAGGSPVPSSSSATFATLNYNFASASSGTITLSITSPSGLTTNIPLNVSTTAVPSGAAACP